MRPDGQCDISEFCSVNEYLPFYGGAVGEGKDPSSFLLFRFQKTRRKPDINSREFGHVPEDILSHGRVEKDVAHPSAFERFVSSVSCGERVGEFPEKTAPETVVAVNGADSCARQHAAEPRSGLHYKDGGTVP